MTYNPYNNFGGEGQLRYIGQAFFGVANYAGQGMPMSALYNGNGTFFNRDIPAYVPNQGQRSIGNMRSKSWWYVTTQGGYVPYNNGSTEIVINQGQGGQTWQSVNIASGPQRVWVRTFTGQSIGYGGTGGKNFQGYAQPGTPGTATFNVQGYANEFIVNGQGTTVYGAGGGGGAGQQGRRTTQGLPYTFASQFAPSGGGSGGGGAGFGVGGQTPDARYQGGAGQPGGYFTGGAGGGGGGGQGAGGGGAGGIYNTAGGGSAGAGGAAGQAISYPGGYSVLY